MAISKQHRILIATDGSPPARSALATVLEFPWASSSLVRVVIARSEWLSPESDTARAALARHFDAVGKAARRGLSLRWDKPEIVIRDKPPVEAILAEARRFKATVIVLGWRGHGTFHRLLAGSVSRAIGARAQCPVLIVRKTPRSIRRLLIAFDGSANAKRALDFVCSLEAKRGSRVVVVNVVEPVSNPASLSLLPASARSYIQHEVAALNDERKTEARKAVAAAVAQLKRNGWPATGVVQVGAPLDGVLSAANEQSAEILVLGARATSGLERALLGSVANGALNRSHVPVLLVR